MFTFRGGEDLETYRATGVDSNFHTITKEGIIIGGGAITVSECFVRGHSAIRATFANEVLCGHGTEADTVGGNFIICAMEVWGFDCDVRQ